MSMEIRDYNGEGEWSRDEIMGRYSCYCEMLGIEESDISPMELADGKCKWIYPVMHKVVDGIERGDEACKLIGTELIEEDQQMPFGRILKSNTARALRRAKLTPDDVARIRARVVRMLLDGMVPHEYQEYAKLLRRVGLGDYWPEIQARANRENPYVMRYYRYYRKHCSASPAGE